MSWCLFHCWLVDSSEGKDSVLSDLKLLNEDPNGAK